MGQVLCKVVFPKRHLLDGLKFLLKPRMGEDLSPTSLNNGEIMLRKIKTEETSARPQAKVDDEHFKY